MTPILALLTSDDLEKGFPDQEIKSFFLVYYFLMLEKFLISTSNDPKCPQVTTNSDLNLLELKSVNSAQVLIGL